MNTSPKFVILSSEKLGTPNRYGWSQEGSYLDRCEYPHVRCDHLTEYNSVDDAAAVLAILPEKLVRFYQLEVQLVR
jgi:hypothetical protein